MIARKIENQLRKLSEMHPVVTITGPRQSGKTSLAKTVFPEHKYVSLEILICGKWLKQTRKAF